MKKAIAVLMVLSFIFVLCACAEKHYDENNISELYDSEWIIGKSREEIKEKYGKFNREFVSDYGEILGAYYVNYDNRGMDPSYIHDSYFVEFDDEDVAIDAYFRKTSIGG